MKETKEELIKKLEKMKIERPSWGYESDELATYREGYNDALDAITTLITTGELA